MKILFLSVLILVFILFLRYIFFFQNSNRLKVGDALSSQITLLSDPQENLGKQIFYVNEVRVEAPFFPKLSYGDRLEVKGDIEEYTFKPLNTSKEIKQLVIKRPEITQLPQNNIFVSQASFLRNRVYANFKEVLPGNEAALLFGIVFGGSSGFTPTLKDSFRNTGVLHVVAASGMNVAMVGAFLVSFLSFFMHRRAALWVSLVGIFYYSLISGFEPSIIRASLMIGFAFIAAIFGRQNYVYLTLILTAWVMIMFQPLVIFEIGFLLSFSSTLGILVIKPLFDSITFVKKTKVISDDISTTLSAQVGSLPIMVGSFGTFSAISIVVNALVLWTIPFLMILGGIASLCAITLPLVSYIPLYIAMPFLLYFEYVVSLFGKIPLLHIEHISLIFWVGYYILLGNVILLIHKRKKKHES